MYVILQPNSNTNPSNEFRVVHSKDWVNYVNGAQYSYAFVSFDTYSEAQATADKMNNK